MDRLIFHIDVNNAFLSWEAAYRLKQGETIDLRSIPSVVGGSEEKRHGIVLAKSMPAKEFNIKTGETLYSARTKCKDLVIVPPRHDLYEQCSLCMNNIFKEYTLILQKFSVDESFLDFSNRGNIYSDYMKLAEEIKNRIKIELGFTVNIGISSNKILAKVASDFKKPDRIHTLFPCEIQEKMWPLPVENLFMVGGATEAKLHKLNINTIGDLANYDLSILKNILGVHGEKIWQYANGIDFSEVTSDDYVSRKGIGNSTTTIFDVTDRQIAHRVLLSLCETVGMRLRDSNNFCNVVVISIKDSDFVTVSHQIKLNSATDSTRRIYETSCKLFDEVWKGNAIRLLGVQVTDFSRRDFYQCSILDDFDYEKDRRINKAIDEIRLKYGVKAIVRSCFLNSQLNTISQDSEEKS